MQPAIYTPANDLQSRPLTLEDLQRAFLADTDVKPSSRSTYARALRPFFTWLESTGRALKDITRADVLEYREGLVRQGLSALTIGAYLVAVRKFYEWTEARKLYPNIAKGVKPPRRIEEFKKEPLSERQAGALLDYYRAKGPEALRDFALITLQLNTGLRLISLSLANIGDLATKEGRRVLYYQSKGHSEKNQYVILNEAAQEAVFAYLETRPKAKEGEPLFVSESNRTKGQRLTTRTLSRIAKDALRATGVNGREYTAHSLRHTFGTLAIMHGAALHEVQRELGHTSPTVTQRYIRKAEDRLRLDGAKVSGIMQKVFGQKKGKKND